jgi:hypothetical protein
MERFVFIIVELSLEFSLELQTGSDTTKNIPASPAMLRCAGQFDLELSQRFQFAHKFKILSIHCIVIHCVVIHCVVNPSFLSASRPIQVIPNRSLPWRFSGFNAEGKI